MARAPEGPSLTRVLDLLRAGMAVEDALRLVMMLILLRHEAEDTAQADENGYRPTDPPLAWQVVSRSDLSHPFSLEEAIGNGLSRWESDHHTRLDLEVPSLGRARAPQLAPLLELVATTPDPPALFDTCLEALTQTAGKGGQYFTPRGITSLLVDLMDPREGEGVYDPACGSGGFLLQSFAHVAAAGGRADQLALYGQDVDRASLQIAAMNLAVHGVEARLAGPGSTLLDDRFRQDSFDVVMVNPPFNQTHWDDAHQVSYDPRWIYGAPPAGNANFAWVQHGVSKMSASGRAAVLLPTGAASGARPAERDIRARLVEADVLSCVVELPAGLIPHVRNAVSLWLFSRSKQAHRVWGNSDRRGQFLLIDARDSVVSGGRGRRALSPEASTRIAATFASWRGAEIPGSPPGPHPERYEDVPGWCRSVSTADIAALEYDVLPTRHTGTPTATSEPGARAERVVSLTEELYEHFEMSHRLECELRDLLGPL
ncbi:N-6 DNA methylase [Streptomyces sp. NPDC096310]|uniref:N-6 DNA methylase n=1 Tax=Streptomyces sp. NPDC096310 TaxID=3366082 RepID=UPI00382F940D